MRKITCLSWGDGWFEAPHVCWQSSECIPNIRHKDTHTVRILYMILMVITMVISENKDDNNSTTFRVSSAYVGVDDMLDPNARVGVWSITVKLTACPWKIGEWLCFEMASFCFQGGSVIFKECFFSYRWDFLTVPCFALCLKVGFSKFSGPQICTPKTWCS